MIKVSSVHNRGEINSPTWNTIHFYENKSWTYKYINWGSYIYGEGVATYLNKSSIDYINIDLFEFIP